MKVTIEVRLAGQLLRDRPQRRFEVDLLDQRSCERVAEGLRACGCQVERLPNGHALQVRVRPAR